MFKCKSVCFIVVFLLIVGFSHLARSDVITNSNTTINVNGDNNIIIKENDEKDINSSDECSGEFFASIIECFTENSFDIRLYIICDVVKRKEKLENKDNKDK